MEQIISHGFNDFLKQYRKSELERMKKANDIISSFLLMRDHELVTELNTMTATSVLWDKGIHDERVEYLRRDRETIRRLISCLEREQFVAECSLQWDNEIDLVPSEELASK